MEDTETDRYSLVHNLMAADNASKAPRFRSDDILSTSLKWIDEESDR